MTTSAEELLKTLPDSLSISNLATTGASESLHFDAKRCSVPLSDDDKNNLATALSGFANSDGGVLIYGLVAAGGDKKKGIPDVVTKPEPIKNLNNLESELNSLVGQLTEPPVSEVKVLTREYNNISNNGFILVYVPASDSGPHRSVRNREYYRRHGSGFYKMEHFELAEMFGRRRRPQLEMYWNLKLGPWSGAAPNRIFNVSFIVGLKNVGRGIAKYPAVMLTGVKKHIYGLDGNGNLGLRNRVRSDHRKLLFGGGADDVIYPDSVIEISALDPIENISESTPKFKGRTLDYELYADEMPPVRGVLTIDEIMLKKRFDEIRIELAF